MFRTSTRCEVRYGHFAEFIEACEEINRLCREAGLKESRILCSSYGKGNIVVLENEYAAMDELKREETAFYENADIMKVARRSAELVVQGSMTTELLEPAPHLA